MNEYLVTWKIDMDADNPSEAAVCALITQRDPESTAVVFEVTDKNTLVTTEVDLSDSDYEDPVDRFENAVREYSWIGAKDPAEHAYIVQEYHESKKLLLEHL